MLIVRQVISAQLGCSCHWIGTTTDPAKDADAAFVFADLAAFGVDATTSSVLPTGSMPVSVSMRPVLNEY